MNEIQKARIRSGIYLLVMVTSGFAFYIYQGIYGMIGVAVSGFILNNDIVSKAIKQPYVIMILSFMLLAAVYLILMMLNYLV